MNKVFQRIAILIVGMFLQVFLSMVAMGFQEASDIRELYVPFSDLNLILEADPNRPYSTSQHETAISHLKGFVQDRAAFVDNWLVQGGQCPSD